MKFFNWLKINKITVFPLFVFAVFTLHELPAQTDSIQATRENSHTFTKLSIEVRADFSYDANYPDSAGGFAHDYGFNGKYFNLAVGGEFGKGFSYFFRQRIIANKGTSSLFDNTDFLYLQWQINNQWALRAGKEALRVGGFEYDAAPIDVLFYTHFWGTIHCFQLAASVIYTDKSQHNQFAFQVGNSPYVYYAGTGNEWRKGLLAYSLYWAGSYPHFTALYSVNMFERKRGCFVNYISLGNKIQFGNFSWYIDYMNRAIDFTHFFADFTAVSRMDYGFKDVNVFIKAGYDQNMADEPGTLEPKEIMMEPGQRYLFYGLGVEYRPAKHKNVRVHGYVAHAQTIDMPTNDVLGTISGNVGVTWNIDFLKYLRKQLNPSNL